MSERRPALTVMGLYPRAWRNRYGAELEAVLETDGVGFRTGLDLVRGAIDAHLHPDRPSPIPVVAAVTASALAVAHTIALSTQPVPPEWPGYLEDALPLIIGAVAALVPAVIGLWLKLGDTDGAFGRLGLALAIAGHVVWLAALLAAALRIGYGPVTAIAATVAMVGTAALGVALVGHSRVVLGALLALAALAGIAPPGLGWVLFAGAWTAIAAVLVVEFGLSDPTDRRPIRAR
jgi:hypothetical protein